MAPAPLGNRLSVVDPSETTSRRPSLRAPAWSCAWGGWCVGAPRILSDGVAEVPNALTTPRPIRRQRDSHGRRQGRTVALYDLRRAAAPPRRLRGAHTGTRRVSRVARVWGRGALRGRRRCIARATGNGKIAHATERIGPRVTGRRARPRVHVGRRAFEPAREACHTFAFRAAATGA